MFQLKRRHSPTLWKGLVAGIAGGLAATIVMSEFQAGWKKASEALEENGNGKSGKRKSSRKSQKSEEEGEDATMKAAGKIAELADQKLTRSQKKKGGMLVHYAFGTALGAVYGVAREMSPDALQSLHPVLAGVGYGSAVFVGADEFAVPALGLSESPEDTPLSSHAYGLVSHVVYGLTGELVRKAVRSYLD
jgi:putative membrane protein